MTLERNVIHPIKILWADDQQDVVRGFAAILDPSSTHVEFALDGRDALAKISSGHYDLVLTDLAMPPDRWGGLWLLEELNKQQDLTPVIVVSGEGTQSETIKALRLGAVDYVTKEQVSAELPQQIAGMVAANFKVKRDLLLRMSRGESASQEFKSTLRTNLHTEAKDQNIELAAIKSIAAFLNSNGGNLLIGVDDSGGVVGIELDQFANADKFQLHFWNLVRETMGTEVAEFMRTDVYRFEKGTVFSISCQRSNRPVYVKWKGQDHFFVRAGPQTEQLGIRQAVAYINNHFPSSRNGSGDA